MVVMPLSYGWDLTESGRFGATSLERPSGTTGKSSATMRNSATGPNDSSTVRPHLLVRGSVGHYMQPDSGLDGTRLFADGQHDMPSARLLSHRLARRMAPGDDRRITLSP